MARKFVMAFGLLMICVGGWVLIKPLGLKDFADLFLTPSGLWVAIGLRLVIGVLLWISASASRFPRVLQVLGALFVLSAVVLPVVGLERMQSMAAWGAGQDTIVLRTIGLLAAGLGLFIAYSVSSPRNER